MLPLAGCCYVQYEMALEDWIEPEAALVHARDCQSIVMQGHLFTQLRKSLRAVGVQKQALVLCHDAIHLVGTLICAQQVIEVPRAIMKLSHCRKHWLDQVLRLIRLYACFHRRLSMLLD